MPTPPLASAAQTERANLPAGSRRPPWMKIKIRTEANYRDIRRLVRDKGLHTVCEEARCPNIYECWERRSATIMILGDVCTRSCGFCAIKTGRPSSLDEQEPSRAAEGVKAMGLAHCVITSVNRDELPDGGARIWAETIREIHRQVPGCSVEVLIPDFRGDRLALQQVMAAHPEILAHNLETVPRLYSRVRPQANYRQSLEVLRYAHAHGMTVKAGIMVGIGERPEEVYALLADAVATGCQIFTIGQYLQPDRSHLPVDRFVHPTEFDSYRRAGLRLGFKVVESGPLVRSSYHADEQAALLGARSAAQAG
ncbi:MAG: lipoyl synthase [Candidatus Marinimicrobia bacterium]|nr:lipoyl synthase [Candidatus Neomarinimicrobiota bacterium]